MKRLFGASLRVRLLIGTLLGVSAALLVAGLVLSNLFREQVARQFQASGGGRGGRCCPLSPQSCYAW